MSKGYLLVEGQGEVAAAPNLVSRLSHEAGAWHPWTALRWPKLHLQEDLARGIQFVKSRGDAGGLLVLRDEDDACPRQRGPEAAGWLRTLSAPFPIGVVLFHREYEVLFLPCLTTMAGRPLVGPDGMERPGLLAGTSFEGGWESRRGVKEWLSQHFPAGRSYKPTLDQLPMTKLLDFPTLRRAEVPCFGTLERALSFVLSNWQTPGGVYPTPP